MHWLTIILGTLTGVCAYQIIKALTWGRDHDRR